MLKPKWKNMSDVGSLASGEKRGSVNTGTHTPKALGRTGDNHFSLDEAADRKRPLPCKLRSAEGDTVPSLPLS